MKKSFIIAFALSLGLSAAAQDLPKKMAKGIEVAQDEFLHTTSYSTKFPCLTVTDHGDSVTVKTNLSVIDYGAFLDVQRILVLTNGQTTVIERNEDFRQEKQSERYMAKGASGNFGSASYQGARFDTRIIYKEVWQGNAAPYLDVFKSLGEHGGKIRFDGNKEVVCALTTKQAEQIKRVVEIYEYLKQTKK